MNAATIFFEKGRNDSRTYAKNVAAWSSDTQLSPEEEDAISNARPAR